MNDLEGLPVLQRNLYHTVVIGIKSVCSRWGEFCMLLGSEVIIMCNTNIKFFPFLYLFLSSLGAVTNLKKINAFA